MIIFIREKVLIAHCLYASSLLKYALQAPLLWQLGLALQYTKLSILRSISQGTNVSIGISMELEPIPGKSFCGYIPCSPTTLPCPGPAILNLSFSFISVYLDIPTPLKALQRYAHKGLHFCWFLRSRTTVDYSLAICKASMQKSYSGTHTSTFNKVKAGISKHEFETLLTSMQLKQLYDSHLIYLSMHQTLP